MNKKIAVLTSGGVDSAVALILLKKKGYDVTAFYLKIWLEDELSFLGQCPWQEDLSFVEATCKQFEIPLEVLNLQKAYHQSVIELALEQMKSGLTPNPDIFCNSLIKFGTFAKSLPTKFTHIATGHYAKTIVDQETGLNWLLQTPDLIKDQTYFLALLSQTQLQKCIFPLGDLTKLQVRQLAKSFNLPNQDRKDSQGLCFLGKINFNDFLKEHLGEKPGDIIEIETKNVIGSHQGLWFHTIGQRKGLGLSGGPWYVVSKNLDLNQLFISKNYYSIDKPRNHFTVTNLHWITLPPTKNILSTKLRHGPQIYSCQISLLSNNEAHVLLLNNASDQGISPGQFAVFYDDKICLGAGMISY